MVPIQYCIILFTLGGSVLARACPLRQSDNVFAILHSGLIAWLYQRPSPLGDEESNVVETKQVSLRLSSCGMRTNACLQAKTVAELFLAGRL